MKIIHQGNPFGHFAALGKNLRFGTIIAKTDVHLGIFDKILFYQKHMLIKIFTQDYFFLQKKKK